MPRPPHCLPPRWFQRTPWLPVAVLLFCSPLDLHAQASGGAVVHGGGKGGFAGATSGPSPNFSRAAAGTKTADQSASSSLVFPARALCSLSAPLLNSSYCDASIECGPGVSLPCQNLTQGIAMTAAGTGLRNTNRGTISLFNLEGDAEIVLAIAVWAEIAVDHGPAPESRQINLDGIRLTGKRLLEADDPCWFGEDADGTLRTYIADATSIVQRNLQREFEVVVPYARTVHRRTPWRGPLDEMPPAVEDPNELLLEGISLIVFYTTASVPYEATSYLHVANEMLCHTQIYQLDLDPVLPESQRDFRHVMVVADSQARRQDGAVLPYRLWLTNNGPLPGEEPTPPADPDTATPPDDASSVPLRWAVIRGPLSPIDKHPLTGAEGGEVAQLWDTANSRLAAKTAGLVDGLPFYRVAFEPLPEAPVTYDYTEEPPLPLHRFDCAVPLMFVLTTR